MERQLMGSQLVHPATRKKEPRCYYLSAPSGTWGFAANRATLESSSDSNQKPAKTKIAELRLES